MNARSQDMNLIRGLVTAPTSCSNRCEAQTHSHVAITSVVDRNWRRAENSNLTQFPVPSGFEAAPAHLSGRLSKPGGKRRFEDGWLNAVVVPRAPDYGGRNVIMVPTVKGVTSGGHTFHTFGCFDKNSGVQFQCAVGSGCLGGTRPHLPSADRRRDARESKDARLGAVEQHCGSGRDGRQLGSVDPVGADARAAKGGRQSQLRMADRRGLPDLPHLPAPAQ